jgi:thiol-disulfide isomerase/thioredoxin
MMGIIDHVLHNKKKMRIYITLAILVLPFVKVECQELNYYPEIEKLCPDFTIARIEKYKVNQVSRNDLKGRYVIFDFWSTGCVPCVKSLPEVNLMQEKFRSKLDFILVGLEEKDRDISKFYKKYEDKYHLNLAVTYDSTLFKRFVPASVPHLIWVNKEGIVKAITLPTDLTDANIERFLNDKNFEFSDVSYSGQKKTNSKIDVSKPLLINGNGGNDTSYLFRSLLSKWKPGLGDGSYLDIKSSIDTYNQGMYQTTKASLANLYTLAYFGTLDYKQHGFYPIPILNCQDTSLFNEDYLKKENQCFNYSVEVPRDRANLDLIMSTMKNDLKSYFHHDVKIIEKEMPCLSLVVTDQSKIKKISMNILRDKRKWNVESKQNVIVDCPWDDLARQLARYLPFPHLAYNDTGLIGTISMMIKGDIDDLDNIRKELNKKGLDLKLSTRKYKVLLISDLTN